MYRSVSPAPASQNVMSIPMRIVLVQKKTAFVFKSKKSYYFFVVYEIGTEYMLAVPLFQMFD